jgi:hypothetical protein
VATVYSTRFLQALAHAGDMSYQVPPGYRAVVRDVDAFLSPDNAPGAIYLWGALGQTIWIYSYGVAAGGNSTQWQGRQVFEETENIWIHTTAPWDFTVSGYLLSLP